MTTCPKCGHIRTPATDPVVPDYQCPACGVVYAKVTAQADKKAQPSRRPPPTASLASRLGNGVLDLLRDKPGTRAAAEKIPTDSDWMRDNLECQRWQTMHIVHCLISVFTAGGWVVVWFLVSASNTRERNKIHQRYGVPAEKNMPLTLLAAFVVFWLAGLMMYWFRGRHC